VVAAAGGQHLGRPEPRVGPQGQLAGRAGAADPSGQLVDEPLRAAARRGPTGPLPGVEDLAGVGAGGQQRVVAKLAGVAVGRATLVAAVNLADRGVHVDRHRLLAGSGAGRPRPAHDHLGDAVQLADVAEGEAAQERPQGAGRHHPVAEHLGGGPGAQHIGVVDAVPTSYQRVGQGQHLAARPVGTRPTAKVDQLIDHCLDVKTLGQRGGQQQPGVGDRMVVVERHNKPGGAVGGCHRESALLVGTDGRLSNAILPAQRAFLIIGSSPVPYHAVDPAKPGSAVTPVAIPTARETTLLSTRALT
jgi:hypothetical protein